MSKNTVDPTTLKHFSVKNQQYWTDRSLILEESAYKTAMSGYKDIEQAFNTANHEIELQIDHWYMRFAANNNISMSEARKLLKSDELSELKWDLKQYIKYAEENQIDGAWIKELENASARAHVSRLEALQINCRQAIEKAYGQQVQITTDSIKKIYEDSYFGETYTIQKGIGVGFNVASIDEDTLDLLLNTPWSANGLDFSDNIWKMKSQLVRELQQTMTRMIMTGKNSTDMSDEFAKKLGTSKKNAERLLRTEGAYFSNAAEKQSYQDMEIDEYQFLAVLDSRTSEICRDMDGMVFKVSQMESGLNAPPMHPNCRSTTKAYFEDEAAYGEKIAKRLDNDQYEYIPSDMSYRQWEKKFTDGENRDIGEALDQAEPETVQKFVPADNLKDAIQKTSEYADKVDLSGIKKLDSVNELNETLEHLTTTYPIKKLEYIEVYSKGRALARANHKGLEIKRDTLNKPKTAVGISNWERIKKENAERITHIKELMEKKKAPDLRKRLQSDMDQLEDENKFAFWGVSDANPNKALKGIISHEYGHVLADQYCGQLSDNIALNYVGNVSGVVASNKRKLIKDTYLKAIETGDIHNLSRYGRSDEKEFFAECFAASEIGVELPTYFSDMLKEVLTR